MSSARNSRRRKRKRGWGGRLLRILCVLTLAGALYYGATVFFQVEYIEVSGNSRYTQEQVVQAAGLELGDNLFRMNKNRMIQRVKEQLPYVEDVTIRRSYPNGVTVQVEEWAAAARIKPAEVRPDYADDTMELAGEDWLISVGGKLLETDQGDGAAIPVTGLTALAPRAGTGLAVPQEEQGKLSAVLELLQALQGAEALDRVRAIDVSGSAAAVMDWEGRFSVRLSYGKEMEYQLRVLDKVVQDRTETERGTIDMTQKDYEAVFSPE